jgi:hypothetical protein
LGKTVMTAELIAGRARHRQMGQLILDHDGGLSALLIVGPGEKETPARRSCSRSCANASRMPAASIGSSTTT